MYQNNHNLFKRMRNCFYDVFVTRWCGGLTSRFENFISDLRNAQKQQKICDESSYTIQNIKCDSKHIFNVTMYFSFK